jgi:hypothetical protein
MVANRMSRQSFHLFSPALIVQIAQRVRQRHLEGDLGLVERRLLGGFASPIPVGCAHDGLPIGARHQRSLPASSRGDRQFRALRGR